MKTHLNAALKLCDCEPQRGQGAHLVTHNIAIPLELGELREGELVAEMPLLVPLLIVLVLVQGQSVSCVLVLILLV